eukprot:INCI1773.1.p1 GENE.INCI1773.1~~INCI1773.1.p1  ORF type:complete len:162 (+),score=41.45 INCI1773.1:256-741(+)
MEALHNPHQVKQPYPWLQPFGFRIGDRVSTLEKSGQWTFKKANGQPATDMTDACVGTTDDPHDELAWTDAAVDENRRLQSINVREKQKSAVLRSENKSLRSDVKSLRRQLEVSDYEKKKMQLTMEKEREKMQALVWEVSRLRVAAQKLAKVQKQLANKYEY